MSALTQVRIDPNRFHQPGSNCWQIARVDRLAMLIDAEGYYSSFQQVLRRAQRTVFILAWDIDSRTCLLPSDCPPENATGRTPGVRLADVLEEAVHSNPDLHIYILCWDFAMIYVMERQFLPNVSRAFSHPRIHFALDGKHPFGGSQHQKVVVVDDSIAFIGGLDICAHRWDTRKHHPHDPRRVDHEGKPYAPFHDIQAVMDGEAARWLGRLCRERWRWATGQVLLETEPEAAEWPKEIRPDFENIEVAISRTNWNQGLAPGVREIERLYLDSIERARKHVYIENQYFTSEMVANAMAARLADPNCPEFVVLLPRYNSGWIEESTMGTLRTRLLNRILERDIHQRIRFYYPAVLDIAREVPISLHSKIMIVDGQLVHMGSSNLSNRSMGLDTECDISLAADVDSPAGQTIQRILASLLAEHMGARWRKCSS